MGSLKTEYHDKEILEKVAEVEVEKRPFSHDTSGVEAKDIWEEFRGEYYTSPVEIMVPNRLKNLSKNRYLDQVHPNRASANAVYRLTNKGWEVVDFSSP